MHNLMSTEFGSMCQEDQHAPYLAGKGKDAPMIWYKVQIQLASYPSWLSRWTPSYTMCIETYSSNGYVQTSYNALKYITKLSSPIEYDVLCMSSRGFNLYMTTRLHKARASLQSTHPTMLAFPGHEHSRVWAGHEKVDLEVSVKSEVRLKHVSPTPAPHIEKLCNTFNDD